MRRLLLSLLLCLPTAACAVGKKPYSPKIQTTSEANRDGLGGAIQAPLRDLNVVRTKIPPVLLDAVHDPYARPEVGDCEELARLIWPLDAALGVDMDELPPQEDEDLMERGKAMAANSALGAVASAASDLIPYRGWVRKLTGAERHERIVTSAIAAGAVRRAYLKGLGEAKGGEPPATPTHVKSILPKKEVRKGPRYPTRLEPSPPPVEPAPSQGA